MVRGSTSPSPSLRPPVQTETPKKQPAKRLRPTRADWMLREAVLGMLPKNKLRALRAKKLRIYLDDKGLQRHTGQKPQLLAQ